MHTFSTHIYYISTPVSSSTPHHSLTNEPPINTPIITTNQAEELGVSVRDAATRVFSNAAGSYSANVGLTIENGACCLCGGVGGEEGEGPTSHMLAHLALLSPKPPLFYHHHHHHHQAAGRGRSSCRSSS